MDFRWYLIFLLSVAIKQVFAEEAVISPEGSPISFSSPKLEDDDDSIAFPRSVKCDGCRVLAYKIKEALDHAFSRKKKSKKGLPETDIIDTLDELCIGKFEDVGLKSVNGVTRLNGPGLETKDMPGMMMGGGKWRLRFQSFCGDLVGEIGEYEIYQDYMNYKDKLSEVLCHGEGIRNSCNLDKTAKTKKTKSSKKEEL